MKLRSLLIISFLLISAIAGAQSTYLWKTASSGGFTYKYVTNDPTKTRFYTLENGLTVILSQNNKDPKIVYKMAVRAGSNNDPADHTGLAHYLEHLLFKGTTNYGTMDFQKEKPYLEKITALYEVYNKTVDTAQRKAIYKQIDEVSGEASSYSIANEYVKMMKSIGSETTNAHTSVEETVYEEDLPSNQVDKFLALQAERFRSPEFRLFHTELEAVYEEKNRGLDDDDNKMYAQMLAALFPANNYGLQTTIGTIEHLKNPSLVDIKKFYNTYYVPNNMALIMSGDLDYDRMIKKIDKDFAYMTPKPFVPYAPAAEKPLKKSQTFNIYGPSAEKIYIGYRGYTQNSRQSLMLNLIASILSNQQAGLMDININMQQKMLSSGAGYNQMKDYGVFLLYGNPLEGQSLVNAKKLLLAQIALLKQGKFDASLIKATVANNKFIELQSLDNNSVRADLTMHEFIMSRGNDFNKTLASTDDMAKITKKQIVDFANKFFVNDYAVVIKHIGEDKSIIKVEKPAITPVKTNANEISAFAKKIIDEPVKPITPNFIDYSKDLNFGKAGIADVISVQNKDNEIFRMNYRFEMGNYHNKYLQYAAQYISFLGTDKYSADQISKGFYNIACTYAINVAPDYTTISITGLQENFDKAVSLMESVLANCKPDETALKELKSSIIKNRENNKLDKESIMSGLTSYAQFGADNPFNYGLSNEEIKHLKSADLVDLLHNLTKYPHTITYYGPQNIHGFSAHIIALHPLPKAFYAPLTRKQFVYTDPDSVKVYFANYDMVQSEIRWVRNSSQYDSANTGKIMLFNQYFGADIGSMIFQIIRESKALAYSTYAYYITPTLKNKRNTIIAYVGTQADKMNEAIAGMNNIISVIPESPQAFDLSKSNVLSSIASSRITKDDIISTYFSDKRLGFDHDARIDQYKQIGTLNFEDIKKFHQENLSGKSFNYCIVASDKNIHMADLVKYGKVIKLNPAQIFGY